MNLKSIRRKLGNYQRGKKPILLEELHKIISAIEKNETKIRKIRDKSIILLGFSGGLEDQKLYLWTLRDIEFVKELKILLQKSKTDQYSNGFLKGIPYLNDQQICAVTSLKEWINVSNIKSGPLFRKISKSEKLLENRLTGQTVALIIKKYAKIANINNINFSGHSLRSWFCYCSSFFRSR